MAHEEAQYVRALLPYPVAPVCTVYSPTGTAYMKVTPNAATLELHVEPRVVTQALVYAPLVTHKIADTTTTIGSADATDLASSRTLADELLADCNTHIASTTYHLVAGTAIVPGHKTDDTTNTASQANMSNLATGYVLADELDDDVTAHLLATTFHQSATTAADFGGTPNSAGTLVTKVNLLRTAMIDHFGDATVHTPADIENARLATATTIANDEATAQTLINLLKTYWNSHCAVGDTTSDDLAAVIVYANAVRTGLIAHFGDGTTAHGGTADTSGATTVSGSTAASNQSTANTLLTLMKGAWNTHCALLEGGSYVTVSASLMPLSWRCLGSFFVKTDTSSGVFTVADFRSA